MTGRLFRILHGLRDNGQAWGSTLTWVGLVVFSAASPISIAATNIAWGVALAGLLVQALSRDDRFASLVRRTDLDAPLACFVLASLLAVLHSLDIESSIVESRSLGLMVIFFLFAWQVETPAKRKTLVRILIVSSCVSALYGWIQFLTGWDLLGHYRPESKKVCGFFGLHLTYGEHLSMVICLGMGLLLWADAKRPARVGGVLALGLMASAVLLSGSKGALLSLAAGLGVVFALRGRKSTRSVCDRRDPPLHRRGHPDGTPALGKHRHPVPDRRGTEARACGLERAPALHVVDRPLDLPRSFPLRCGAPRCGADLPRLPSSPGDRAESVAPAQQLRPPGCHPRDARAGGLPVHLPACLPAGLLPVPGRRGGLRSRACGRRPRCRCRLPGGGLHRIQLGGLRGADAALHASRAPRFLRKTGRGDNSTEGLACEHLDQPDARHGTASGE